MGATAEIQTMEAGQPEEPTGEPEGPIIGGAIPDIGTGNAAERQAILELLEEYQEQFAASDLELGRTHLVQMSLDTGDHQPIKQRAYREAWSQREALKRQLDAMLEAGVIEESHSPWASPVVMVPKHDGSLRFCCDYRRLNGVTVKDATPLPLIQDVLEAFGGARYFTNLDLRSGYWQIPMRPEDQAKTAFITYWGLFHFRVMPFGLSTAPAQFQRLMQRVLGSAQRGHCMCFLDDVIIYSRTIEEHIQHLRDVFERFRAAGLKMKMSKCAFLRQEVAFLGHRVSSQGVSVDPTKVAAMQSVPAPRTVREVRAFLGMAGYYRRFVAQFATIALPLTELTKKDVAFKWTSACQRAFDELKTKLTSAPVLAYPSMHRPFVVYTDASGVGVGAVLAQPDDDGEEKVVCYLSQKLSPTQQRWTVSERECWSIICALMKFRHYLLGRPFVLYTDHKPLKSLFVAEMKNARLLRWATTLGEFDVDIRYQKGREMRADYLSRLPECGAVIEEAPEEDLEYLPQLGSSVDEMPRELRVIDSDQSGWKEPGSIPQQPEHSQKEQGDLWDRVPENFLALQKLDPKLKVVIQELEDGTELADYVISDHRLYHVAGPVRRDLEDRLQLVLPRRMIGMALNAYHNKWGHQGVDRTYALLRRRYHWEGMYRAVVVHVDRCKVCQPRRLRVGRQPMVIPDLPTFPMQTVASDMMGPLPRTKEGFQYIVTFVCLFTGYPEAFPTRTKNAEEIAAIFLTEFIPRHTVPLRLLTDQGGEYQNRLLELLAANLGMVQVRTAPYRPSSNGVCERFNRVLSDGLSKRVWNRQEDWVYYLPCVLLAYRTSVNETTRYSPMFLLTGRDPVLPMDTLLQPKLPYTGPDFMGRQLERLHQAFLLVKDHMRASRERNKRYYDRRAREVDFRPGDQVYYWHPTMAAGPCPKFTRKWHPHYRVVARKSPVNYVIRHQPTGTTKLVHGNHLQWARGEDCWEKEYHQPGMVLGRRPTKPKYAPQRWDRVDPLSTGRPVRACRLSAPLLPPQRNFGEEPARETTSGSPGDTEIEAGPATTNEEPATTNEEPATTHEETATTGHRKRKRGEDGSGLRPLKSTKSEGSAVGNGTTAVKRRSETDLQGEPEVKRFRTCQDEKRRPETELQEAPEAKRSRISAEEN